MSKAEKKPILMTAEYWMNTPLSVARHYGGINWGDVHYVVVNEHGETLLELAAKQEEDGREWLIPPGFPTDLIDEKYVTTYRKIGRDKFIEWVKEGLELKDMKKRLKEGGQ